MRCAHEVVATGLVEGDLFDLIAIDKEAIRQWFTSIRVIGVFADFLDIVGKVRGKLHDIPTVAVICFPWPFRLEVKALEATYETLPSDCIPLFRP